MGLRPTKTNENAGILRCFRISSLARTFKGAKSTFISLSVSAHWEIMIGNAALPVRGGLRPEPRMVSVQCRDQRTTLPSRSNIHPRTAYRLPAQVRCLHDIPKRSV